MSAHSSTDAFGALLGTQRGLGAELTLSKLIGEFHQHAGERNLREALLALDELRVANPDAAAELHSVMAQALSAGAPEVPAGSGAPLRGREQELAELIYSRRERLFSSARQLLLAHHHGICPSHHYNQDDPFGHVHYIAPFDRAPVCGAVLDELCSESVLGFFARPCPRCAAHPSLPPELSAQFVYGQTFGPAATRLSNRVHSAVMAALQGATAKADELLALARAVYDEGLPEAMGENATPAPDLENFERFDAEVFMAWPAEVKLSATRWGALLRQAVSADARSLNVAPELGRTVYLAALRIAADQHIARRSWRDPVYEVASEHAAQDSRLPLLVSGDWQEVLRCVEHPQNPLRLLYVYRHAHGAEQFVCKVRWTQTDKQHGKSKVTGWNTPRFPARERTYEWYAGPAGKQVADGRVVPAADEPYWSKAWPA